MIWYDLDAIWYDVLCNLVRRMPFGTILDEIWYDLVQSNISAKSSFRPMQNGKDWWVAREHAASSDVYKIGILKIWEYVLDRF